LSVELSTDYSEINKNDIAEKVTLEELTTVNEKIEKL